MKVFYLGAAILGTVIPCGWVAPWLSEHGLDAPRFVSELFSTRVGAFFGLDVLVSAVVLVAYCLVGRPAQSNERTVVTYCRDRRNWRVMRPAAISLLARTSLGDT
jgi:hypothetical protein